LHVELNLFFCVLYDLREVEKQSLGGEISTTSLVELNFFFFFFFLPSTFFFHRIITELNYVDEVLFADMFGLVTGSVVCESYIILARYDAPLCPSFIILNKTDFDHCKTVLSFDSGQSNCLNFKQIFPSIFISKANSFSLVHATYSDLDFFFRL